MFYKFNASQDIQGIQSRWSVRGRECEGGLIILNVLGGGVGRKNEEFIIQKNYTLGRSYFEFKQDLPSLYRPAR